VHNLNELESPLTWIINVLESPLTWQLSGCCGSDNMSSFGARKKTGNSYKRTHLKYIILLSLSHLIHMVDPLLLH